MASQPLNADISVNRRVRAKRVVNLNRSTTEYRGADLEMVIPAEEDFTTVTRNGSLPVGTDTSLGAKGEGLPRVRLPRTRKPLGNYDGSTSVAPSGMNVADIDFPVRIGQDVFLQKAAGSETDDLHQDLRDVS